MSSQPEISKRPRGWFYPWRWRFWFLTAPAVFIMALMILFWWPGLSCNFEIGNWLKVERVHGHEPARADVDQARFKIGLAEIAKEEGVSFYRRERGFEKVDDSTRTGFTYVGDSVILTVFVLKNWHER